MDQYNGQEQKEVKIQSMCVADRNCCSDNSGCFRFIGVGPGGAEVNLCGCPY